jgi:hypothetical protein
MFQYARILVLLVATAVVLTSGCTQSGQPHLGGKSELKDMSHSKGYSPKGN